jgi:L-lactate dehydrogenase complex protein LldF
VSTHQIFGTKLRDRTAVAITDKRLHAALGKATDQLGSRKELAFAALADADGLRQMARALKARILARLPEILERLADNAEANGVVVHWAATAEEANAVIVDIAARAGARRIVKSKSMASEEIGLNEALEHAGCTVTETDLGEWIIQVADEKPSHIITPAIHRDRDGVADVLSGVAGERLSNVPEELAAFARGRLRERFVEADLGISGVNFAIAETGTLHLVTNEGNGRLSTSLPRVHVAVMGMERVVETWAELDVMLALLPRAATGQAITTYNSFITGPRRPGEPDGPDELHLVIIDNGRSDILGTEFNEMLACIRCGACLNACPVYRQVGGHAYGWVYSGPMGAVLTPLLLKAEEAGELSQASSLCGACWDACPVAIPLQDMLLALRRRSSADQPPAAKLAWKAWAAAWSRPAGYKASLKAMSLGGPVGAHVPGPHRRWTIGRDLPVPARKTFRQRFAAGEADA